MAEALASNRKPPDELADVRERQKALKAREDELREVLLSGSEADLIGDEFAVEVTRTEVERIDTPKLRAELGLERLRPFLKTSETVTLRVKKMRGEVE